MVDPFTSWEDGLPDDVSGCRYVLDGNQACGAAEKPGSSYCPKHHARCYLTPAQEREKEREIEALARAVGGRFAARRALSARELRRIEKAGTLQQTRIG